jgi:predicted thioesterase
MLYFRLEKGTHERVIVDREEFVWKAASRAAGI